MLSIRQLRYALAVWREGTFVKAAEKVHISQPAISEQVGQLESEIGFELFRRTGHGVEVTDLGRTFLLEAEEVYLSMLRLNETANQLRGAHGGLFSIGLSSGVTPFLVPEVIRALSDLSPKLRLEISTTTTRQIYKLLLDDSLDVGLTVETNPRVLSRELVSERVATDKMALIVPKNHRFTKRKSVKLKELIDEPLIMSELSVGYSEVVLSMFSDLGLHANISAICDNFTTIVAMVCAGAGIAIMPQHGAGVEAMSADLSIIPLSPNRTVYVTMVRRIRKMSPDAELYVESISNHLKQKRLLTD
ncbi:MAG: LysR family transcriptional regulator [marine bacterium B5-7]|nr:MAG: LysR family transcriptional regulator [marine bacterium B5-7]